MTISRSNSWLLCLLALGLLLAPQTIRAQGTPQKDKETEQRQELEKKTLALLNETASAAWSLKLPENRLFVMANAGDLMWTFDEKRARTLFWDALNAIGALSPAARNATENPSKADRDKLIQSYFFVFGRRQRLLTQIARRDPQLALDMLRATRQVPPKLSGLEFKLPDDRQLEQEIAIVVAARDPAQALQVARQSLAKGLTWQLMNLLDQLNEKDSEKASQFAGDIITKLQTVNVASDFHTSRIAIQLLQISRSPDQKHLNVPGVEGPKVLSLDDEQKRQLVELLTNAALSASANSNLLHQINEVMPEIQQFFPERRAGIERKLATFNQTLTTRQRAQDAYNALVRSGAMEEMVRSAATADDETRHWLYHEAAMAAIAQGKTDSFRDFLNTEVSDSGERSKVLDSLDTEEISAAVFRKRADDLRKLLPGIARKEERARAMAELAVMLKEKGEDAEASGLLDDAAALIKTDLTDEKKTNALLTFLCAYAIVDPPKAFALAGRTIDQANTQISLLLLLDRVVKSGAVKRSEILLEQAGMLPLDVMMFRYGNGVAALAKADFNRTKALADRFDRNELKLMAQLLIIKGILQPQNRPQISTEEHR
jgi:hypothetical protein